MEPLQPGHANKIVPLRGTEFSVQRVLVGYAYPVNGNVHNPTPNYRWNLLLDGRLVDTDAHMRRLVEAAKRPGAAKAYRT